MTTRRTFFQRLAAAFLSVTLARQLTAEMPEQDVSIPEPVAHERTLTPPLTLDTYAEILNRNLREVTRNLYSA